MKRKNDTNDKHIYQAINEQGCNNRKQMLHITKIFKDGDASSEHCITYDDEDD